MIIINIKSLLSSNLPNSILSIQDINETNWIHAIDKIQESNDQSEKKSNKGKRKRNRSKTDCNNQQRSKKRKINSKYTAQQFRDFKDKNKNVSWPSIFQKSCKLKDYISSDDYRMHISYHLIQKVENVNENSESLNQKNTNTSSIAN